MNKYPVWKYLLIVFVTVLGFIYAAPNLYPPDPAVQVSAESAANGVDERVLAKAQQALDSVGIAHFGGTIERSAVLIRLNDKEQQLKARAAIRDSLGDGYVVALNLAPSTPEWLRKLGGAPMKLGLDLSGGVHFLLEVDTDSAVQKRMDSYLGEVKKTLRQERIRGLAEAAPGRQIVVRFKGADLRDKAWSALSQVVGELQKESVEQNGEFLLRLSLSEAAAKEIASTAVSQNLITLRNRVNELGVAEPLVQRQGSNRIVVELPGVQDTSEAKRILGKTANLEFRMEAGPDASGADKEEFAFRDESDGRGRAWLEREVVITGDRVSNAQSNFDENSRPQVSITLDSQGGSAMHHATRDNIGRNLGVLFIERKSRTVKKTGPDGQPIFETVKYDQKQIISLATIQSALGTQFRITGLDNPAEASELALLLRAGALAAPMDFVEERTVGPSLGADNIKVGVTSAVAGFLLVVVSMLLFYKVFGLAANVALLLNVVFIIAIMSILSATLTLPGIAGIVLTVGMAVDANVIINCRIREEVAAGVSPQQAIHAGYDRAFSAILDSNLTTLLAAAILYGIGTGPVKGFAVTLAIGIATSMFTAITCSRAVINLIYGGRKVEKLWI